MTLRMRSLIASAVAAGVVVVMGLALLLFYVVTAAASVAVHQELSPAVDDSARLMLSQANASGALSDFVLVGRPASLADYEASIGQATTLLDDVGAAVADDVDLTALVAKARTTQSTWVEVDAQRVLDLMEAGNVGRAERATNTKAAWASYDAMIAASTALNSGVNETRNLASEVLETFADLLGRALLFTGLLVIVGLLLFFFGLHRWVLVPLTAVRRDLQRAAREPDHESPIAPTGPPELRAVATDAELLRRGLVQEIDEARAAREGLAQDAPLVDAMRSELTGVPPAQVDGLAVFGTMQSAEGVMAGDWWDSVATPAGALALVVADVSGHGAAASVTAVRVRAILRSGLAAGLDPAQVLTMAAESCSRDAHFVTALVAIIDPVAGALRWANAGHPPAIVVTHDKGSHICEPTGPLLSVLGGAWTSEQLPFGRGDVVVAFTDGLVESRDTEGDELEASTLSTLVRGMDAPVREHPEELVARLLAAARARATDWRRDDVTLVAVARPR